MMELEVFISTFKDKFCSQMYFLLVRSRIVNSLGEEEDVFYFKIVTRAFFKPLSDFIAHSFTSKL